MGQFLAKVGTTTGDIEELALTAASETSLRDDLREDVGGDRHARGTGPA